MASRLKGHVQMVKCKRKDQWSPRSLGQGVLEIFLPLIVEASCQMYPPSMAARIAWEWAWLTEAKNWSKWTGILPQYKLCVNLPISRMHIAYIINLKKVLLFKQWWDSRLKITICHCMLLLLFYVKHSVGSRLFFQLHSRHHLNKQPHNCCFIQ